MSAPRTFVRCFVFITILFCFLDLEPLIDYQHCKKQKTPKENPQRPFNKKIRNVLGQDFLQRLWFFLSLCLIAVFCFWIRKPPSATRTRTAKNTKTPEGKPKEPKKKIKMFGRRTFFRGLKFLLSLFFVLLDPDDVFIGY